VGIDTQGAVINLGTIIEAVGVSGSDGVYADALDNSGTISVSGIAASSHSRFPTVINSGWIESTGSIAVGASFGAVSNNAGGIISGFSSAIVFNEGGKVINAGTINGDVVMNPSGFMNTGNSVYVADGGTLNGNLSFLGGNNGPPPFQYGNDILLARDGITGTSGTIDAGAGYDLFGSFYRTNASATVGNPLPATFEGELLEAIGTNTVVTITASTSTNRGLTIAGDGQIVNRANLSGPVTAFADSSVADDGIGVLAAFTNAGDLASGFSGTVKSFVNNGSIEPASNGFYSVAQKSADMLSFDNAGTIAAGSNGAVGLQSDYANQVSIQNSGQITGAVSASVQLYGDPNPASLNFSNSGTISIPSSGTFNPVNIYAQVQSGTGAISVTNTGTLDSAVRGGQTVYIALGYLNPIAGEAIRVTNSGRIISSNQDTTPVSFPGSPSFVPSSTAISLGSTPISSITVINDASGVIEALGPTSTAISSSSALSLTNSGTISGSAGNVPTLSQNMLVYRAGAIEGSSYGDNIVNSGTITGSIDLSAGNDSFVNSGTISGNVSLGDGDDFFEFDNGSSVIGTVDGGTGLDRLTINVLPFANSLAPTDLSNFTGFEKLSMEGGTGTLSGPQNFSRLDVIGGRLIGLAGSTINASQGINVAPGAMFGSAGTVNGNISVGGTLSPGASPGTMTINGNVSLASGSTTLFEMTPTVSDALVISGSLAIQSGATLDITGTRPLTPGATYDLITAGNGITGSFSTISQATTVLGFVRQTANAVQLLGTLQLPAGANTQVTSINSYINNLLVNGTATSGLYAVLPSLVASSGYANPSVLSTLQPEAYASASQIGIDNGLALSSAVRSIGDVGNGKRRGFFGLGQGFGGWHRLNGEQATGVSHTNINISGFLGGIGFASEKFVATAFVGRVYADQSFGTLAAKTKTDGTFVGGSLAFTSAGLLAGGSILWDDSSADTHRTLYDGSKATGHYNLRSLTLDGHIGYRFNLGKGGWQIGPRLGFTHVAVKRGAFSESGAGAFSLDVSRRTTKATFFDADLEVAMAGDAVLRPWLSAGWQHQVDGDPSLATASFTGTSSQFTTLGVERAGDFAHVGAGVDWSVTPSLDLSAKASSALGSRSGANDVTLGLRLGF
jgi:outer membrane autotransporter protein